jgi:hypothetical protein
METILDNMRFGKNLVLRKDPDNGKRCICRCDCGFERSVLKQSLLRGESTCCRSCQFKKQVIKNRLPLTLFWRIKHNAKERNLEFELTTEELYQLFVDQNELCKLSGLPISLLFDTDRKFTASLDRIDSSKGYTKDNVQWLHKDINFMKQAYSQERFISLCKLVANNN